ncbi:hypothetical protein AF335_26120 [Streptomyces eurocidicus]|uniref:DUF11 domain-containing protein n=1 Tax=Streptomyces eurocidicus TaxID=66423 RepID=A0A2N8NQ04_STREU|nr:hypothetical protein [Streptomyces eurocidicus]MBB5122386.1 hypothetical protein [Streptomyces eurocidicus]MBF6051670.1 hypothetical protein [Streptomyces eurocidicus]PNE30847.1 hypothetical protein AF335_26120 [Streptomyces eurocidicus]
MRRTTLGRLSLSAILAFVVALLGLAGPASAADTPPMTITVDKQSATPGSTVTIKLTFTNDQTTNSQFVYQSIQPTYTTTSDPGLKYAFDACTGDTTSCTVATKQSGAVSYKVPVLPGASRTVTLTYKVGADSACGPSRRIEFYTYLYYEYQGGQLNKSGLFPVGGTDITCATPGTPAAAH